MKSEASREAFEKMCRREKWNTQRNDLLGKPRYASATVQGKWNAWQEADAWSRSQALEEAAQVCEAKADHWKEKTGDFAMGALGVAINIAMEVRAHVPTPVKVSQTTRWVVGDLRASLRQSALETYVPRQRVTSAPKAEVEGAAGDGFLAEFRRLTAQNSE